MAPLCLHATPLTSTIPCLNGLRPPTLVSQGRPVYGAMVMKGQRPHCLKLTASWTDPKRIVWADDADS